MSIQTAAKYTHARWQAVASKAQKKPETRLFIDGKYVDARKGGRFTSARTNNTSRCSPVESVRNDRCVNDPIPK